MTSRLRLRNRPFARLLAGLVPALLALAMAERASAQPAPALARAPVLTVGADEASVSRKVELTRGRSLIVDLPRDAKEVFVANPEVADAVVRSTRKVFIIGRTDGATSIFVMDADGRQIAALDVTVQRELNLGLLRQTLLQTLPDGRFDIRSAGDSIILSGSVASAADAARAADLANAFLGVSGGAGAAAAGGGAIRGAVVNNLTIREKDQVMLRVTVVEVARNVIKQLGINTSGNWTALNPLSKIYDVATGQQTGVSNALINNSAFPINGVTGNQIQASVRAGGFSLQATLKAFEQAGVSRVLAEPTLTAVSGESANFTAGGEIPIPAGAACAGLVCTPTITYKTYGVTLNFTPVVLSENRISVRVGTNVTELDPSNSITYPIGDQTFSVPATRLRKSETTVELPSGGVMMTAGLIQQVSRQAISGLPGLINLPVLGALFRSRDYQRQETELMILVTPFIAKAMPAAKVSRPDDSFVDATDTQAVLLGQINRIYGAAGGHPIGAGYRGRLGFIAD